MSADENVGQVGPRTEETATRVGPGRTIAAIVITVVVAAVVLAIALAGRPDTPDDRAGIDTSSPDYLDGYDIGATNQAGATSARAMRRFCEDAAALAWQSGGSTPEQGANFVAGCVDGWNDSNPMP